MDRKIILFSLIIALLLCMVLLGEKSGNEAKTAQQGPLSSPHRTSSPPQTAPDTSFPSPETASPATTRPSTAASYKGCTECSDGTACGASYKAGEEDVSCVCEDPFPNGEYGVCYISRGETCTACVDGTACGEANKRGDVCECDEPVGQGKYMFCGLARKACSLCEDATLCGAISRNGMLCQCQGGESCRLVEM